MAKFYCDYCGVYLLNSSPKCRRQHYAGRRHKQNMAQFYRSVIVQMAEEIRARQQIK